MLVGIVYLGDYLVCISVKEIQYYCGRLDFRHVVDKHMVHFFCNIHKTSNVVVQRCLSNFKSGVKFKRLCNEYGFTIYDNLLSRSVCDKFRLQFQLSLIHI